MAKLSTFLKMLGPKGRVDGNYKYLPIYFRSIPGLKKGEWSSSHVRNKNCLLEEEKISNALNSHFNFFFSFNNNKYSVYMECASISFSSSYKLSIYKLSTFVFQHHHTSLWTPIWNISCGFIHHFHKSNLCQKWDYYVQRNLPYLSCRYDVIHSLTSSR